MRFTLTSGGVLCVDPKDIAALVADRYGHVELYLRGHGEPFRLVRDETAVHDLYRQMTNEELPPMPKEAA